MKKLLLLCLCCISFQTIFGLSMNVTHTDIIGPNCSNGSLTVDIYPDFITNAFKVRITGPGNYVNETCPVGAFQSFSVYAPNLASGTYVVEVWRLGFLAPCTGPYDAALVEGEIISSPSNFTASISHTNDTAPGTYGCANGSLTIATNFTYQLTANVYLNGSFFNSHNFVGQIALNNLVAGNYSVELNHPCYNTVTLTDVISSAPCNTQFNPAVIASDQGCNNGSISFTVLNGVDVEYYDVTVSSIPSGYLVQSHLNSYSAYQIFNNLAPGSYWVTVYEHRIGGIQCYCQSPSMVVDIPETPCNQINSFQAVQNSAINCNTGVINLELNASANNLFKLFRNGIEVQNFNYQGSSYSFQNLEDGNYEIQVFNLDQCSCSVSATTTVSEVSCSIAGPLNDYGCYANFTGYIENACPPYNVKVYRGNNNNLVDSISPGNVFDYAFYKNGNYTIVLTDGTGCTSSTQLNVNNISCNAPSNLSFATLPGNKVKLLWDAEFCAVGYSIQYRLVNAASWTNIQMNVNKDYKVISNILQNEQYEWRIRTKCSATTKSEFSTIENFCSGPNCSARLLSEFKNSYENHKLQVTPNPASEFIKISFDSEKEISGALSICNEIGKKIYSADSAIINDDFTLNISTFPAGFYIINFVTVNKNFAARFIKAN